MRPRSHHTDALSLGQTVFSRYAYYQNATLFPTAWLVMVDGHEKPVVLPNVAA